MWAGFGPQTEKVAARVGPPESVDEVQPLEKNLGRGALHLSGGL